LQAGKEATSYLSNFFGQSAGCQASANQSNFFGRNVLVEQQMLTNQLFGSVLGEGATICLISNFLFYSWVWSSLMLNTPNFFGQSAGKEQQLLTNQISWVGMLVMGATANYSNLWW
jgi:hypothetical protein